jgi:hypothetical protein
VEQEDRKKIVDYLGIKRYDCDTQLELGWCKKSDCEICTFDGIDMVQSINTMSEIDINEFMVYASNMWWRNRDKSIFVVYLFRNYFDLMAQWLNDKGR